MSGFFFFCPINLKEFYSILFLLVFFICIILPRSLLLQLHFAMSLLAFSDEIFTFAMALFFSSIASVNLVCLLLFLLINFFRAMPLAYGSSQTRGRIGATAASLHHSHSHAGSKPSLQPIPQLMAMLDP